MNLRKNRRNSRKKQRRLQQILTEVQAKIRKSKGWRGCPPWGRATGAAPAKRRLRRYYYKQRRTDRRFCGWRHTSCGDPAVWSSSELWFSACCRNCNIKPCGKSSFSEYDQRSYLCKRTVWTGMDRSSWRCSEERSDLFIYAGCARCDQRRKTCGSGRLLLFPLCRIYKPTGSQHRK